MRHTTYYLDAYLNALADPPMLKEAKALLAKLSNVEIRLNPDRLLAGEPGVVEPFDFNYACGYFIPDWSLLEDSKHTSLREKIIRIIPNLGEALVHTTLTQAERDVSASGLAMSIGFGGHMTFDYRHVLGIGLPGIASEIERCSGMYPDDSDKQLFFEAMRLTLEAVRVYIRRHADEAEQVAGDSSAEQAEKLTQIADDCRVIAEEPPRTFRQALQLLWFLHVLNDCDSFGRFDRALDEYYKRDLAAGTLSREYAAALLEDIWPRIYNIENMTIGGQDPDGRDSSTDFTLLVIEVMERMAQPRPNLCLRVHSSTPDYIWDAAVRCIGGGTGCPALYNDDVIIPALVDLGIEPEDARDYSLAGCSQVVIPGRCNFGCDDGLFNAAKCLELALHDGVDPVSGKCIGPSTGAPDSIKNWDDMWDAFRQQVEFAAKMHRDILDKADLQRRKLWGYALRTLLTRDCLPNAAGIWEGGAKYNAIQTECLGITNAADSLAALKKLVFDDQICSLPEMVRILNNNWEGAEDMRLMCLSRAPKYGNDDPAADEIAARTARVVWEEIRRHKCSRKNGWIIPGGVIFVCHVSQGKITGATPDGRHLGDPLADSSGPAQGRDRSGPTAVLKSAAKLPLPLATTCPVINLKFGKRSFVDSASRTKLRRLFETYFVMGGIQLQITVVDKEALLAAQRDPESYRGLIVRVGGYSSYWHDLSPEFQNEIISRTESA